MSIDIKLHKNDLPDDLNLGNVLAVDGEFMGLDVSRDPLCLIQLSSGNEDAHIVQLDRTNYKAPNLAKILSDNSVTKIFHYARFDVAVLNKTYGVTTNNIYCTKIASKIARTYTDRHGLKDLCKELLDIELSKEQQSSDWGSKELSNTQQTYAANDVIYLHDIKKKLDLILSRENRLELAYACFKFIKTQVELDLRGWHNQNIFDH